jgi:hypothetical protein
MQYINNAKKKINRLMIQTENIYIYYEVMYVYGSSNLGQHEIVDKSKL